MSEGISNAQVEQRRVADLIPYENNNKKHPASQIEALAKSIEDQGLENPILIEEDGTIISGHGRHLAVQHLGREFVAVRVARGITKEQARKLRIAANKTTSIEYDTEALSLELKGLADLDIDLGSLGINEKEILVMVEDVGEMDLGSLTTDIKTAVETHERETEEKADEIESSEVSIAKVFGVKKIPVADARAITRFLGIIEAETGEKGLAALMAHVQGVVAGA